MLDFRNSFRGDLTMRRVVACLCLVIFTFWGTPSSRAADPPVKALHFGKLVDGKGKVWTDAIVIVRGERIADITTDPLKIPAGAEVIDLRRYTAIPGLIDVHTHITYYWDQTSNVHPFDQQSGSRLPAVTVFLAAENARRTLEVGVTTVRDLGANDWDDIAMRDLINRGAMVGPRMFVAGYGLHVNGSPIRPGQPSSPDPGTADGVAEVQRVARQQLAAGADWIKVYGSTGSDRDTSGYETFTYEEMKAAADVAHFAGKRIAIHSYGPAGAKAAVRAGVESVEHAIDMDDSTLAEMVRRGTV